MPVAGYRASFRDPAHTHLFSDKQMVMPLGGTALPNLGMERRFAYRRMGKMQGTVGRS